MTQQTPSVEVAAQNLVGNQNLSVLLVDGGGRGHAIAWQMADTPSELAGLGELIVAPGNPGTAAEGAKVENRDVSPTDIDELVRLAMRKSVDLVIPTMDDTLALGIVDRLAEVGIPAFGPTKAAAQIEASKDFAKDVMRDAGIPTAAYQTFENGEAALTHLDGLTEADFPLVVKQDQLAAGKGVTICKNLQEAQAAVRLAPGKLLIEEYLEGPEISLHAVCGLDENGRPIYKMYPASQDHKQLYEGDKGPNTGGMGTTAPLEWFGQDMVEAAGEKIVKPLIGGDGQKRHAVRRHAFPGRKGHT